MRQGRTRWRVVHRRRSSLFRRAALLPCATGETCLRSYIFMYTYPCEAKRHGKRQLLSRTHSHTRKKNARAQTLLPTSGLSRRLTNRSWTIGTLYSSFLFLFFGQEKLEERYEGGEGREGIYVNFVLIFYRPFRFIPFCRSLWSSDQWWACMLLPRSFQALFEFTRPTLRARRSSWIVDSFFRFLLNWIYYPVISYLTDFKRISAIVRNVQFSVRMRR